MRHFAAAVCAVLLAGAIAAAHADEVDDLVRRIDPPERFAGHTPAFTVDEASATYRFHSGERTVDYFVVRDGPRIVALIDRPGGTIRVQDFRPDRAPRRLVFPTDRPLIETARGSALATGTYIPSKAGEEPGHFAFTPGDGTLTLVRRFKGTHTFNRWAHHSKAPETIDATNTFVFRCDPVHGYVVEGTYETRVKPAPKGLQYFSAATSDICNVWYGEESVERTVITPTYKDGFEGYGLNFAAVDWSDNDKSKLTVRDGGFGGYLNRATGWSPVNTIEGSTAKLVVCNAHADLDFVVPFPSNAADADGFTHTTIRTRLLALPPEVTKHVWDAMAMRFEGRARTMIRIGRRETFEDQPLPVTCSVRGLVSTGGGPKITTEHAHSGERSAVFPHGRFWPNLPQVPLEGGARYRLSAWMKLVPWTKAERDAAEQKARERIAKRKAAGKETDPFEPFGEAEAYITADTYVSSPHQNKWIDRMRTEAVKPGSWRKVTLEFTAAEWAPFVNFAFVTSAGTAYLDDFEFVKVGE
jgi:hypothetical protein